MESEVFPEKRERLIHDDELHKSAIKEIGLWFEELSKEFSDDAVFGFVIRGMIEPLKHGDIPARKIAKSGSSPLGQELRQVFGELNKLRPGYTPPKRAAEAKSILTMLKKGFTAKQIIDTWKTMKADKFWQKQELYMMSVESQIGAMVNKVDLSKTDPNRFSKGRYASIVVSNQADLKRLHPELAKRIENIDRLKE